VKWWSVSTPTGSAVSKHGENYRKMYLTVLSVINSRFSVSNRMHNVCAITMRKRQQPKKMKAIIEIMINRLLGKATLQAKGSSIRGGFSWGRKDMGFEYDGKKD
jgi:hypothetical protein